MSPADWSLYHYRGRVSRVVDGDTLTVMLSLGLDVYREVSLRLAGVNAPEIVGTERAAGLAAKAWLVDLIEGEMVWVRTIRDRRSFARYVGDIWYRPDGTGELHSLGAALVAAGMATWSDMANTERNAT